MVVLSPAGTKLIQQNGRFHWEFGMRQRDALKHSGEGGCGAYPAGHLTVLYVPIHTYSTHDLTHNHLALSFASLCHIGPHAHSQTHTNLAVFTLYMHIWRCIAIFSPCVAHTIQQTVQGCAKPARCPAE